MIIISATGGSGSSFLVSSFLKRGWNVCARPDGGHQKLKHSVHSVWENRVKSFFDVPVDYRKMSQREMFDLTYDGLRNKKKTVLLCMSWGGMGFLKEVKEKVIYLVRDPVFAFNSYSGGGWRDSGGERRIRYVGASDPNDKKWIDAFLGYFSLWKDGAKNAIKSCKSGKGHIVRYHRFKEDWRRIGGVHNVRYNFSCKDNNKKVIKHLTHDTIAYIKYKTKNIWSKIIEL